MELFDHTRLLRLYQAKLMKDQISIDDLLKIHKSIDDEITIMQTDIEILKNGQAALRELLDKEE